ncbi:MAG: hypothetical protein PUG07_01740 [Ruminococcus sp.]|nr:hypothetical protein [Ruminococcus sp.]
MLKKTWEQIADAPKKEVALPFACGVACGILIGLLAVPFSKGIVIGSYNNCNHRVSDESVRELPEQDGENYEE